MKIIKKKIANPIIEWIIVYILEATDCWALSCEDSLL